MRDRAVSGCDVSEASLTVLREKGMYVSSPAPTQQYDVKQDGLHSQFDVGRLTSIVVFLLNLRPLFLYMQSCGSFILSVGVVIKPAPYRACRRYNALLPADLDIGTGYATLHAALDCPRSR